MGQRIHMGWLPIQLGCLSAGKGGIRQGLGPQGAENGDRDRRKEIGPLPLEPMLKTTHLWGKNDGKESSRSFSDASRAEEAGKGRVQK